MKIAVAGVGYVGLVTAVTLADIGHDVICLDIDKNKLKMLNEGVSPIYEYGLEELMLKNRERLTFTDDVTRYAEAQVIIIGVGTPEKEDGSADLGAVFAVADSVADNCSDETVVVVKSTVPIGTCESVRRRISERRASLLRCLESRVSLPGNGGQRYLQCRQNSCRCGRRTGFRDCRKNVRAARAADSPRRRAKLRDDKICL